jgi:Fic-DOC domain mobile mystery protein B
VIGAPRNHLAGGRDGQTPLDPDEAAELRSAAITTREELDAAEEENVVQGVGWALSARRAPLAILEEAFVHDLHRRMFGDVWRWAGRYRTTSRNIGVVPWPIAEDVGLLLGDARFWLADDTYGRDELCARLHHRLVSIHPFPNGNGRHARLVADILRFAPEAPRSPGGAWRLPEASTRASSGGHTWRR